jgi:succinyl-diaminopimelate desuccinylase
MKAIDFINENKEEMLKDLEKLVAIPSVYDESTASEKNPFGVKIGEALECILNMGKGMGMKTNNIGGYAGEIIAGEGEKTIGILGHIDVVAGGEGWDEDPFDISIKGDRLYGRGTLDDKGALVASLYAMKYLKDEGIIGPEVSIKMIVGTDEEEEWRCIEHYKKHTDKFPEYTIVPDANFPLVTCEKGLLDVDFSYGIPEGKSDIKVVSLSGGVARNVVPSKASITLKCGDEETARDIVQKLDLFDKITCKQAGDKVELTFRGVSAHAMSPEKGVNAVSCLMQVISELGEYKDIEDIYSIYNKYIGMTYYGEKFGCSFEDELSGKLTFNVGTIEKNESGIVLTTSIRYPATIKKDKVIKCLKETCEAAGIKMDIKSSIDALFVDPDSEFVKVLMEAYKRITGDNKTQPLSMGGATYARSLPNAVAFGPLFPYEEEIAHEPNEFLSVDSFKTMTLIYIEALKDLISLGDINIS